MRPKPPGRVNSPGIDTPPSSTVNPPRLRPDSDGPTLPHQTIGGAIPPHLQTRHPTPDLTGSSAAQGTDSATKTEPSRLYVTDIPVVRPTEAETSANLDAYFLPTAMLRGLKPPDNDGFRIVSSRKFVDVINKGTVYVEFDATIGAYRATDLYKKLLPGPALYKIDGKLTWSETKSTTENTPLQPASHEVLIREEQPGSSRKRPAPRDEDSLTIAPDAKRKELPPAEQPVSADTVEYVDLLEYAPRPGSVGDAQGNILFLKRPESTAVGPPFLVATKDKQGRYVKGDWRAAWLAALTKQNQLKDWYDHEITELYGLLGDDIARFRAEAQAAGKKPEWARYIHENDPAHQLINGSLRFIHPNVPPFKLREFLASYNLTTNEQARLRRDIDENGTIPQWAEDHKRLSLDTSNAQRFESIKQETLSVIPKIRQLHAHDFHAPDLYFSNQFLDDFASSIGYQKNKHGLLYRTDIPAMFRGDDRTPFELARDGRMIAREGLAHTSTQRSESATFSLSDARDYATNLGGYSMNDKLSYNSQANIYPGKRYTSREGIDDRPDIDYRNESTDSDSDTDTAFTLDKTKNYEPLRHRQETGFIYMIDTRGIEIVPGRENRYLNPHGSTGHDFDGLEGVISISKRGLSAERIWLVKSDLTRAAPVNEIYELAGNTAKTIEKDTWNGKHNIEDYDRLIDEVVDKGWGMELPDNPNFTSDDVTWP